MALQTVLEKLDIRDEKNFLIQGLPSSIEKPFSKINYAKSVTPLLRSRRIDFALVFAVNIKQLAAIIADVCPALHSEAKLWVAYPNLSSKIYSELSRDYNWDILASYGFEEANKVFLDNVWIAISFQKTSPVLRKNKIILSQVLETV
jgi:hypothetical protein